MSGRGKYRGNRNRGQHSLSTARETALSLPADSPVLAMFRSTAQKLTVRQDRHERLVKLSRDVTIESKRIIFLLHSAITKESLVAAVTEAKERLNKLLRGPIKSIGLELEHCPPYMHSNAVTAGFQEFVEARTLCSVIENRTIATYTEIQKDFQFTGEGEDSEKTVMTLIPFYDYMLGLADLTGELMRRAINSISSGESEECFFICQLIRDMFTGYMGLSRTGKEMNRKTVITRTNVSKVEAAVYALCLRGGEAPPTLLLPPRPDWPLDPDHRSDDEGFY